MFGDGALAFREGMVREPLPLATIHDAILFEFLPGREDAVLFGAQAVNAYVSEARMTQEVDLMSTRGEAFAEDVRKFLHGRFGIAARVREIRGGIGYRVYQQRKPDNRHLVDVRPVESLPAFRRVEKVKVVVPEELIAMKVISHQARLGKPKAGTDFRDLAMLLLTFPDLKSADGPVRERLAAAGAEPGAVAYWDQLAAQTIEPEDDDAGY